VKIIILGAGQVGSSLAASLVHEKNEITVVDTAQRLLEGLQRHDLRTVYGNASHPSILERAGASEADMIVAVTNSDETNMLACQVAYTLFHTPTKIARIRSPEYLRYTALFSQESLPIDVIISPESLVTEHVTKLISLPGTQQVVDFAGGKAQLVSVNCAPGNDLAAMKVGDFREKTADLELRIVFIHRQGKTMFPKKNTRMLPGDEVFFIGSHKAVQSLLGEIYRKEPRAHRIILAGGGNIGKCLAIALEAHYQVKIIEIDPEQAQAASEILEDVIVLRGSATDEALLTEENIDRTDVFCAITNNDETNIIAAMLAKNLGAKKVMALINHSRFTNLVQQGSIDILISPQLITMGALLAHIRKGDVVMVHSLLGGKTEAMEAIIHGDKASSPVVGRPLKQIDLPQETMVGAIVRGDEVITDCQDTAIQAGDHLIVLVSDKQALPQLEQQLFQVGATYL